MNNPVLYHFQEKIDTNVRHSHTYEQIVVFIVQESFMIVNIWSVG